MILDAMRRAGALLAVATLLASTAFVSVASPTFAATPKCDGKVATIVSRKATIRGTNRADVIVAKGAKANTIRGRGGNDRICAGRGRDSVYGGAGIDRIFGGPGNDVLRGERGDDRLAGGPGTDTCYQGAGSGARISCERPPTLIPLTGILAVAYSEIDGLAGYSTGDVLIARLLDTSGKSGVGQPGVGDTIEMGRYPTSLDPNPSHFAAWGVERHTVTSVEVVQSHTLRVTSAAGTHQWQSLAGYEGFNESNAVAGSDFYDGLGGGFADSVFVEPNSPSYPASPVPSSDVLRPGDQAHIDVILNYTLP